MNFKAIQRFAVFLLFLAVPSMHAGSAKMILRVGLDEGDLRGEDHRVLQAAIDFVAQYGGGTVKVGPGRFLLADAIHLRSGVRLEGVPGKTILVLTPGRKTPLARNVAKGAMEIKLADPAGFSIGDGIFLQDKSGHGFEVTAATLVAKTGPATYRLSIPAQHDYLLDRDAEVKRGFSGITGNGIKDAEIVGMSIEGNWKQAGSQYMGGCRGAGIYLAECEHILVRDCFVTRYNGDAISFQKNCQHITIEQCRCEGNANVGLHPGSYSHSCVVRNNILRDNGYVGLFVCVGVRKVRFENNIIEKNAGCGISIGFDDSGNLFRGNRIVGNAETGVLFRRDSAKTEHGAHDNIFENNLIRDNLGPRPARSNSRPASAGKAAVVIEGSHNGLVFRNNEFAFSPPHTGSAILHDANVQNLTVDGNRLINLDKSKAKSPATK